MRLILSLFSLSLLLSACSSPSTTKSSGDLCSGTKRPYQVNGITYTPQHHYEYDEEGIASWYGPGFNNKPGSCGSIFDQNALTAAHKTLPIPSVVEVTNKTNGRKVKLVINDRGPFVDNRIIDLSKRAAQELGTHANGLGNVHVKTLPEESKALATYLRQFGRYGIDPSGRSWDVIYREEIAVKHHDIKTESPEELVQHVQEESLETILHPEKPQAKPEHLSYRHEEDHDEELQEKPKNLKASVKPVKTAPERSAHQSSSYFIQVGSFIQKNNAHQLSKSLTKHGKAQVVMENPTFYTVQLGPYSSQQQAKQILETVAKEGHRAKISQ